MPHIKSETEVTSGFYYFHYFGLITACGIKGRENWIYILIKGGNSGFRYLIELNT